MRDADPGHDVNKSRRRERSSRFVSSLLAENGHPLLFTTTGKEHIVSKDGMKGTVNVKSIADDTIEIEENDYYLF